MKELLSLADIHKQMSEVAGEDQAPVLVDRLQFLDWVVSLMHLVNAEKRSAS